MESGVRPGIGGSSLSGGRIPLNEGAITLGAEATSYCNPRFAEMLGRSPKVSWATPCAAWLPPPIAAVHQDGRARQDGIGGR